mmetsp:Transcript_98398/g.195098  ORF Transcript_98398/g.195098 Transcript_98398/m.195098 type:complete len:455 (-) Transcript_98398:74-1438(-)|eukprot:CAMPEP_0172670876 /NCGR_PEP_ID=MMETSP1074-20121228/10553_1 /TAXON_ID=2916 /ORGANISM="Ceratium fusus, Strain PA161109" /LENGTH=454 /DNA_ID=CAMNT_0013487839 /DNA_START=58 /DNA_END=1422 /DNA_ORIENTATION=+
MALHKPGASVWICLVGVTAIAAQDLDVNYILLCQSQGRGAPVGAINNVYPGNDYSWIVPSEMAVAGYTLLSLGQVVPARVAGDYLAAVQLPDGSWADQYHGSASMRASGSTRYTVQPVMFMAALHARGVGSFSTVLKRARSWLISRSNPNGLLTGGDNPDFWLSDNAYAVVAWHRLGEFDRRDAAVRAINQHFMAGDCWHQNLRSSDLSPGPGPFGWVHFAPAMLGLQAFGVTYPNGLADRMRNSLVVGQGPDAGAVLDAEGSSKRMPGIGFQASLAWRDLGAGQLADSHRSWAESKSGLWQTTPDVNGISGGWVDWKLADGTRAPASQRFIDSSAYYLMVVRGIRFHQGTNEPAVVLTRDVYPAQLTLHTERLFKKPSTAIGHEFAKNSEASFARPALLNAVLMFAVGCCILLPCLLYRQCSHKSNGINLMRGVDTGSPHLAVLQRSQHEDLE